MPKPLPEPTPLTAPFWAAGLNDRLEMQRCTNCGHTRFPVGPVCTQCLSDGYEWIAVSRTADVLAHLVFHRSYGMGWGDEVPYSVVMVQFPEGPRMFLDVLDPERKYLDQDLVGSSVSIVFDRMSESIAVPRAMPPAAA